MRVLLVDDHPLFMDGLKDLLTANDIEVTGTATNLTPSLRPGPRGPRSF